MKTLLLAGLVVATLFSCKSKSEESKVMHTPQKDRLNIQVQGHRGERGNLPENSIPAFLGALRKGVDG
ncbi:MAG: glycerophosphodiester phosphodiesterase, partial [Leeuwenhoekiella sp.]